MPFKSKAQRAWMHQNLPEVAKRWEREYPTSENLPQRLKPKTMLRLLTKDRKSLMTLSLKPTLKLLL